ncbi:MAG: alpha/beta hydrolase [Ruminococcaceae bacterium]|nr:alpha/beta hydrolase [Oscillospiraceae bacterium]
MKKSEKRLLIAAGIAAVGAIGFAASTYLMSKKLVKIALERNATQDTPENEKKKNQIRGYADPEDFVKSVSEGKAYLSSAETEIFTIESYDGISLTGHYFPVENPKRIVIAMHGWRSSWKQDFAPIAAFWHRQNCSILFCDQRGQGLSGGEYMGFGLMERHDCAEWVKFMHEKEPALPIYLAGVSMGAATVLMASNLGIEEAVHGIIADCAFTSPHAIWKHVVESNLRMSYGIIGRIADDMCRRTIQVGSRDFSTLDAMKENKIPTLFIHGTDDHFVPIEMTYENYKACNAEKRLLIVPGAEHSMSYYCNKNEYERMVTQFFKDYDEKEL